MYMCVQCGLRKKISGLFKCGCGHVILSHYHTQKGPVARRVRFCLYVLYTRPACYIYT